MSDFKTQVSFKALGVETIYIVNEELEDFLKKIEFEAKDRGIDPTRPSDAFDASLYSIVGDASASMGLDWIFEGNALCVFPPGMDFDWPKFVAENS